jgi:hypothetical protein
MVHAPMGIKLNHGKKMKNVCPHFRTTVYFSIKLNHGKKMKNVCPILELRYTFLFTKRRDSVPLNLVTCDVINLSFDLYFKIYTKLEPVEVEK